MITIEKIHNMGIDDAVRALKSIHLSNAMDDIKKPLIIACEKRIEELGVKHSNTIDALVGVSSRHDIVW